METLLNVLAEPFSWGLFLGFVLVFFVWRSASKDKKFLRIELARIKEENTELQGHLNTHLKINAKGNDLLQTQLDELKEQNETLRVNLNAIQQKPGKVELRRLEIMETAISVLREQAPGFAPAWEKALREAEDDQVAAEGGLKKLMRKVVPSFRATPSSTGRKLEEIEGKPE